MQSLADLGFIVVQIDGMGTLNRSKAFHDVAWKNIADAGFPDRILWHKARRGEISGLRHLARRYLRRLGGRAGHAARTAVSSRILQGRRRLRGLFRQPHGQDQLERTVDGLARRRKLFGLVGVDNAWRLQGKLLMIVGEQDENVDPASTMQVVSALVKANKVFDLLVVPGEGHSVGRSTGPIDYGQRKQFDFFLHNLAGQETPDWNARAAAAARPLTWRNAHDPHGLGHRYRRRRAVRSPCRRRTGGATAGSTPPTRRRSPTPASRSLQSRAGRCMSRCSTNMAT